MNDLVDIHSAIYRHYLLGWIFLQWQDDRITGDFNLYAVAAEFPGEARRQITRRQLIEAKFPRLKLLHEMQLCCEDIFKQATAGTIWWP